MTLKGLAQLTEKHKKEMETEVAIQSIKELFAHKSAQSMKGWKITREPSLMCLNITAKLVSTVSENQIYKNFVEGQFADTSLIGLIFVPGCVVIGLLKCSEMSELKVPFVTLISNDWFGQSATSTFVEQLCLRGQFKGDYSKLFNIDESAPEVSAKKAIVNQKDSGRNAHETPTFFISF
jgi:hypothetical protein